jgi:S-DNA-T family DNA segregation ATPase FtsK/SpoIIIE
MCIEALRHVILSGSASISMIQRKCSVGYNRAGNIIEWMEDNHYISPFDGAKARKVLISKEQFENEFGPL